jgi:hypothetical protein
MQFLEEVLELLEFFFLHLFHFFELCLAFCHDQSILIDLALDANAQGLKLLLDFKGCSFISEDKVVLGMMNYTFRAETHSTVSAKILDDLPSVDLTIHQLQSRVP